jgi:thiol-disulfide isomerase/thioredoxin
MMKNIKNKLFVLLLFFGISSLANGCFSFSNNSLEDPILIGQVNLSEIQGLDWYVENYNGYKPADKIIQSIIQKSNDKDLRIEIYFGTWCTDSQYGVPRLIKLLELIDFDMKRVKLIGIDEDKVVPNVDEETAKQLDVQMAPTFIFYEDNKELNRFVEFPKETLEEDVLSILSNEGYQHSYK